MVMLLTQEISGSCLMKFLYTRYPIVARALGLVQPLGRVRRASKGILHTNDVLDRIEGNNYIENKKVHNEYLKLNPFVAKKKF